MKFNKIYYRKKFFFVLLGVGLIMSLGVRIMAEGASTYEEIEVVSTGEVTNGVTYKQVKAVTSDDNQSSGKQLISSVTTSSSSNARLDVYASLSKDGIKGKSVLNLANEYQALHPELQVVAAANADYFSYSSGLYYPINALVSGSDVIKYNNHEKYKSLTVNTDGTYKVSKTNSVTNNYFLTIYDSDGLHPIYETILSGQNTIPGDNQTSFFYKNTSVVTNSETSFFEVKLPTAYFNQASIYIKGEVSGKITSTTTLPIIATKNRVVIDMLLQNPVIRVSKRQSLNSNDSALTIGVGSQPLVNGVIQSASSIGDQSVSFCNARHPRTSLGFKANGDIVLAAIDGRQTNMSGASLTEEAEVMKQLGCVDCFNFDGGGSTELVTLQNGSLAYFNSPSETYRSVVDIILIVVPKVKCELNTTIINDLKQNVNYTLTPKAGVTIKDIDLKVNNTSYGTMNNGEITLNNNQINHISLVATLSELGKTYKAILWEKEVVKGVITVPVVEIKDFTDFNITFEKTSSGFDAIVTCTDESNLVSKVYLIQNGEKEIAIKDNRGYSVSYKASETSSYSFEILYYYKVNSIETASKKVEQTFTYEFVKKEPINFKVDFTKSGDDLKVDVTYDTND